MKTRKELQEEYKQIKYKIGVYHIKNTLNGKLFIGSTLDLKAVWYVQQLKLDTGLHENPELQNDWTQQGSHNFEYQIVEELDQDQTKPENIARELKALETMVLEEKQPYQPNGYMRKKAT